MGTMSSSENNHTSSSTHGSTNNNNNNNNNATSSSSSTSTTSGRERAIETLIDREPQGDFYRAARVMDEAVPMAQAARPNLVTKAALIEQAMMLSKYDIDTLRKFDDQYMTMDPITTTVNTSSTSSSTEMSKSSSFLVDHDNTTGTDPNTATTTMEKGVVNERRIDALQKERIFHYQTQVIATKVTTSILPTSSLPTHTVHTVPSVDVKAEEQQPVSYLFATPPPAIKPTVSVAVTPKTVSTPTATTTASATAVGVVSPPSGLISALRHIFDSNSGGDSNEIQNVDDVTMSSQLPIIDTKMPINTALETNDDGTKNDDGSTTKALPPFELRSLLRSIHDHPIFTTVASSTVVVTELDTMTPTTTTTTAAPGGVVSNKNSDDNSSSTSINNEQQQQQLNIEKIIMNITKQLTTLSHSSSIGGDTMTMEENYKVEVSLQGLLIAILSLLTTSTQEQENSSTANTTASGSAKQLTNYLASMSVQQQQKSTVRRIDNNNDDNDVPAQWMLQVGSLLALLPLENSTSTSTPASLKQSSSTTKDSGMIHTVSLDTDSYRLDPELLNYFASAASIYQERWEIRKARRLARMQVPTTASVLVSTTPPPPPPPPGIASSTTTASTSTPRCHTPPPSLVFSSSNVPRRQEEGDVQEESTATVTAVRTDTNDVDNRDEMKVDNNEQEDHQEQGESNTNENQENTTNGRVTATAETPTAGDGAPDMEFSLRTEDDDDIVDRNNESNSNMVGATPTNRTSSSVDPPASLSITHPTTNTTESELEEQSNRDEPNSQASEGHRNNPHQDESSDSEDDDDDDGEEDRVVSVSDRQENYENQISNIAGAILESLVRNMGERDHNEDDDDDDDEEDDDDEDMDDDDEDNDGASSSSSESDDDDDDDDARMGDSDDAGVVDTDDDEDAVLRQAMAMSMVEQEAESNAVNFVAQTLSTLRLGSSSSSTTKRKDSEPTNDDNKDSAAHDEKTPPPPKNLSSSVKDNEKGSTRSDDESDEANLPPFPIPPPSYHLLLPTALNMSVPPARSTNTSTSVPQLDPSNLSDFGSIPSNYVLFHLLRYTTILLDRRLAIHKKSNSTPSVVVGGVGSTLFGLNQVTGNSSTSTIKVEDQKMDVTLQLLVASTLVMIEQRNVAIENLRKSIAREHRIARDGTYNSEGGTNNELMDDDESSRMPLSVSGEEEDDPALTLAMNYVEDDAVLSSESLESKGMTRKAAAAAYDAAAIIKSLQKRTNSWKNEVHLFSSCVACSLQLLRKYIRSVTRQYFINKDMGLEEVKGLSMKGLYKCLPDAVVVCITKGLASFMSIGTQSSLVAMMSGDVKETERLFQSLYLYKEAMMVWGECIPLLYPSDHARSKLLISLVNECSGFANPLPHLSSLDSLNSFPNSDVETQFYKVCTLCRRLRLCDLLDGFVSRPLHFVADMSSDLKQIDGDGSHADSIESLRQPTTSAHLITLVGNALGSFVGDHTELRRMYLALCHRCQSHSILFDGFYLETETEVDDRQAVASAAKTLSTGDTVRVASFPSAALQFDATKCSDSIAVYTGLEDDARILASGICSVHQRASKVWGTVLSTQHYSPKTGVHRWAVRLDKCERGHVFIGVSTAQATVKTYVGGDKYGWGMIGTQALWHDRRKIRGDYGATFRSGSTIIVTLDTDAGTLSFSSWKDSSASSALSVDPLIQNIISPRKGGPIGGIVEDWGVAFEGLPLDAKLYPAVALYQRDDRVTLLTVESPNSSGSINSPSDISGGRCYYPWLRDSIQDAAISKFANQVRHHNNLLTWDGVMYASSALQHATESIRNNDMADFALTSVLPSLGAALCLLPPSVPFLSGRCASFLMPQISSCILELERLIIDTNRNNTSIFYNGFSEGRWIMRESCFDGTSLDYEEYEIDVTTEKNESGSMYFRGVCESESGKKAKKGFVKIYGFVNGSSVTLIENWYSELGDVALNTSQPTDCCVVSGRLGIDGNSYEGIYRRISSGITGQVAGRLIKKAPSAIRNIDAGSSLGSCAAILCLAQSHLATILGDDAMNDLEYFKDDFVENTIESYEKQLCLKAALSRPLLLQSSSQRTELTIHNNIAALQKYYSPLVETDHTLSNILLNLDNFATGEVDVSTSTDRLKNLSQYVASVDSLVSKESGGLGSFNGLCPVEYGTTRQQIICAMLYHSGFDASSKDKESTNWTPDYGEFLRVVWCNSLRILEDGVRKALSSTSSRSTREKCTDVCTMFEKTSAFLLSLKVSSVSENKNRLHEITSEISYIFQLLENDTDLKFIKAEMLLASQRGLLRISSLGEIARIVGLLDFKSATLIESLLVGLPRQLGRGKGERNQFWKTGEDENRYTEPLPFLDGNYLFRLCGADHHIIAAMRKVVLNLFASLGKILRNIVSQSIHESTSLNESMLISILATFISHLRGEDFVDFLSESHFLELLPSVFTKHRHSVCQNFEFGLVENESDMQCIWLEKICKRDLSRAILRCSVAVVHVLTYQATMDVSASCFPCFDLLLRELDIAFCNVEVDASSSYEEAVSMRSQSDWEHYIASDNEGNHLLSTASTIEHVPGLKYLQLHGTLQTNVASTLQSKALFSKTASGGNLRHITDSNGNVSTSFAQQFLSHWLHILCCVLRAKVPIQYILEHETGLAALLKRAGLQVEGAVDDLIPVENKSLSTVIPVQGRFRARLLRLLLPLFSTMKASESLVHGLFNIIGSTSSFVVQSNDVDEWMVSREATSLLRHLYSLSQQWKACIDAAITAISETMWNNLDTPYLKIGILEFFSGSLESIRRGSYVLIKPSAATILSSENHSLASSKSHSGGLGSSTSANNLGSAPHHLIGNGTSAVITGLFNSDVNAGIVSNIDLKNGSCEVILVARGHHDSREKGSSKDQKHAKLVPSSKNASNGRHTLTIRAVRTALSDVVQAQEVPLFLNETTSVHSILGDIVLSSLDRLLDSTLRPLDDVVSIIPDLLMLRFCIVVLSDKRTCLSFLGQSNSKKILSKVLELAWPMDDDPNDSRLRLAQSRSLAQLVNHEARYAHLVWLLRDLKFRVMAMTKTPDMQKSERLDHVRSMLAIEPTSTEGEKHAVAAETTHSPQTVTRNDFKAASRDQGESIGSTMSQATATSNGDDEEEISEAAATAAAHLREAAIAQMAELGLPRSWSEYALRRIGVVNIEAAVTFCLERGPDIERLIADEQERDRMTREFSTGSTRRRGNRDVGPSSRLLRQLLEMGFPKRWCSEALAVTGNNVDEALTWILNNSERLSEDDEAIEANGENEDINENDAGSIDDEDEDDDDDVESDETPIDSTNKNLDVLESVKSDNDKLNSERVPCWTGSITPICFISGRAIIDPNKMEISGLPAGGFSSVGTKGILLSSGKWYYEAILETAGCLQIGWADGSFAGHCHAERGDGCGDGPSSWAFDGWRRYRWHATATEWGCRWKEGDVVGCLVDMDNHVVSFTLNGEGESIGMGVAFSGEGFRPCGGVYACVSFNKKEKLRLILGGSGSESFKYQPPSGYRGVGEAVLEAVRERDILLSKESVLDSSSKYESNEAKIKRFVCDYSDTDHGHELTAWAHRYYGSDASVHLGSVKSKQSSSKCISNSLPSDQLYSPYLTRRLQSEWRNSIMSRKQNLQTIDVSRYDVIATNIFEGYDNVQKKINSELSTEVASLGLLLARKLLLHLVITIGQSFNLGLFTKDDDNQREIALRFWNVIEVCTSLRSAGWVGEAGAMAIAAEALGLCISSNDQLQSRSGGERRGVVSASDLDENLQVPVGGYMQLLTFIVATKVESNDITSSAKLIPASAEAAMCGDGGSGILAFLLEGLQSAVFKSKGFRHVLVATIRRGVRQLAVVEYENDDGDVSGHKEDDGEDDAGDAIPDSTKNRDDGNEEDTSTSADARLISFFSGLLLSRPMESIDDFESIQLDLFEAWSVGLLSASLPWRMICAFTAAGILNKNLGVFKLSLKERPTLARYFGRLKSTVARRLWAERAAVPICSRYAQSLLELLSSVHRSVKISYDLPYEFRQAWDSIHVDAATPLPHILSPEPVADSWESDEGWLCSDSGWEVWTGVVEIKPTGWKIPSRSNVRTLMDGGDGPPLLRAGCTVMRGVDWDQVGNEYGNDDGKDIFDAEKASREKEKSVPDDQNPPRDGVVQEVDMNLSELTKSATSVESVVSPDPADESESAGLSSDFTNPTRDDQKLPNSGQDEAASKENDETEAQQSTKSKKIPSPRLPIGIVLGIEPWRGIPGMARRVKWLLTGKEGVYRFGGDGGMYDLCHVEVNNKETKVKKRHPLPESSEQCAARHGFGVKAIHSVLLRIRRSGKQIIINDQIEYEHDGILEWPDFGAGVNVKCTRHADGTFSIEEHQLLFGSKDSGWIPRFGEPSYIAGSRFILSSKVTDKVAYKTYEELSGCSEFSVNVLRNPSDGQPLTVVSEMRLLRGCPSSSLPSCKLSQSLTPLPPPLTFDVNYHSSSLSLSRDCRTVSCTSSDSGRGTVFGALGFTKGVHYWEVKLEQADIGSVFIGVAEKPIGSGSGSSYVYDTAPRLNRWLGWGFVNFRATYTAGAERVFGSHCHAGDTVGVMLDCDSGRLSFFFDGLKYGEHILNDLGCAFENLSPFGFNVDGCGSGGTGQGAPSGFENGSSNRFPAQGTIRPRTLWPVIGLRNHGDRVTISPKWSTSYGTDGVMSLQNVLKVDEVLTSYADTIDSVSKLPEFPQWFVKESFSEYNRWYDNVWTRSSTRGSGPYGDTGISLDADFDSSPLACAAASASLGLSEALLAGDRVKLTRSAGRVLQLAEEALVVGVYHGRLYYRIISQKSEGGSLTEGGGRAWCWDESEVVDGLPFITPSKGRGIVLPKLSRFSCQSAGLKVVYDSGAVLRSDLEIFDGSETLGTIPVGTVIPKTAVIDRRTNSCGGLRFRVKYESLGEGWISERIRGGTEELIVEDVDKLDDLDIAANETYFESPMQSANVWYASWKDKSNDDNNSFRSSLAITSEAQFCELATHGIIPGLPVIESDSILTTIINAISNFSINGDAVESSFDEVVAAVSYSYATITGIKNKFADVANTPANQVTIEIFAKHQNFPPLQALLARMALLRSLNRRMRFALPWLSIRPCQEGSAIFGGMYGYGTSPDRSGRCYDNGQSKWWFQAPSIATKIRLLRGIVFTSVKRGFLNSVVDATTTATLLSHDEYELPREIRTVRINRLKAARAMLGDDVSAKRKYSVFSQLHNETKSWGGASLRRGFVAKGHGGQKRAFKVKLIGEGVNDYSGPYREAFTDAMADIVRIEPDSHCSLGVLDPTPNNAASIGENRDLFMFSLNNRNLTPVTASLDEYPPTEKRLRRNYASLMVACDESSREVEESLVFLGRLVGTAFRHGIPLDIPLPFLSVWKALVEQPVASSQKLLELDHLAHAQLENEYDSDNSPLLIWQQRMLNAFSEGLGNVLPMEILPLLSAEELREMMCGNPDVDVELLKQVVEYEGYNPTDDVIKYFWSTLNEMTNDERKLFLQFVWARNRLPMRESDFDAPFKIQKDTTKGEQALPSASTCFFTLTLPEYTDQQTLREKLLFAIRNVTTMETDFQTNSAEIAEGYRSF